MKKKLIAIIGIFLLGLFLGWRILPPRKNNKPQQLRTVEEKESQSQSLKKIEIEKKVEGKISLPQIRKIKTIIYYE
ncbi:hypothetical protein COS93_02000 [bacterium (Candidatus Gribaldobacteria) CG07_land_8_20_14_0_80_33_18]|uniref:Uncharacterized protein n=1 Tax=bacterium (Candidatus Gribaldobacteria) CG07_land_8_20_14_0_80_33_18 TaxID=2014272 RepID=A0A2M6Z2S0_9BACT|nr:MAG: hypothetical protein COU04_01835 [bacterium (Candidatus Gribaldobacteria) CG10_big_fil_rev_8_21_14_0_10_33_41]PIU46676.1 MAG: hypothetical protein COS93_02000 [bacterium (Candidatus Gribaldobacteria) CG07_land_8_20_14_0_80_33_18]PJB09083.1 MAG: hypothetical protein CO122_00055 [bacterium (Candidatus Gribaldobacteria) CG_4_9_14_3_um_filter_33_9]